MLETHVVQIGKIPVRFAVTGRGAPLLLIHGLAGSSLWWRRNVHALSQNRTLYLIDLPGFGSMRAYAREFSLDAAPVWIRVFIGALGLQRPSIVGHSMGAAIALAVAARWPDEVDRLVLVAPAVDLPCKTVAANILPLLVATAHLQAQFYPTLIWDALRCGPRTLLRTASTLLTASSAADTCNIHAPTLLIWGRNDNLVPLTIGHTLRCSMPASRLHVIDGAGHVVMFDRPSAFNDAVLRFLSGQVVGD